MLHVVRHAIREMLLQERVFGAQAFIYTGSRTEPDVFVNAILNDTYTPGLGSGSMYGKGLYAVHDLEGTATAKGEYGDYIYKLRVNLYGYISFDDDVTTLIYGRNIPPSEQAKLTGAPESVIEDLKKYDYPPAGSIHTSASAHPASRHIKGLVKGLVFTGSRDGRVVVVYDVSTATPVAWKKVADQDWNSVIKSLVKNSLAKNLSGDFKKEKYEARPAQDPIVVLRKLAHMPSHMRILDGRTNLSFKDLASLPDNLVVEGTLDIRNNPISKLPENLTVNGDLFVGNTNITEIPSSIAISGTLFLDNSKVETLPPGLSVGSLYLSESRITEIPADITIRYSLIVNHSQVSNFPDQLRTGLNNLFVGNAPIQSLPDGLNVIGDLNLGNSGMQRLPEDLSVGKDLTVRNSQITSLPSSFSIGRSIDLNSSRVASLPNNLTVRGNLDISNTLITELPAGLEVRGELFMHNTQIAELPPDLNVRGDIYGFSKRDNSEPEF